MLLEYTSLLAHDTCVYNLETLNFFILAFLWKLHDMDKIDPSFSLQPPPLSLKMRSGLKFPNFSWLALSDDWLHPEAIWEPTKSCPIRTEGTPNTEEMPRDR